MCSSVIIPNYTLKMSSDTSAMNVKTDSNKDVVKVPETTSTTESSVKSETSSEASNETEPSWPLKSLEQKKAYFTSEDARIAEKKHYFTYNAKTYDDERHGSAFDDEWICPDCYEFISSTDANCSYCHLPKPDRSEIPVDEDDKTSEETPRPQWDEMTIDEKTDYFVSENARIAAKKNFFSTHVGSFDPEHGRDDDDEWLCPNCPEKFYTTDVDDCEDCGCEQPRKSETKSDSIAKLAAEVKHVKNILSKGDSEYPSQAGSGEQPDKKESTNEKKLADEMAKLSVTTVCAVPPNTTN